MVAHKSVAKRGDANIGKRGPEEGFEKKTIALQVASACPPRPGLIYRFAKGQRLKTQGKVSRRHAWNNKSKLSELLFRDIYEGYSLGLHTSNETSQ